MLWYQLTHSFSFVASSGHLLEAVETFETLCKIKRLYLNGPAACLKTLLFVHFLKARLKVPNDWWQPQSHQVPPGGDPISNSKCTVMRSKSPIELYIYWLNHMCANNHYEYFHYFICFSLESLLICVCLVYGLLSLTNSQLHLSCEVWRRLRG